MTCHKGMNTISDIITDYIICILFLQKTSAILGIGYFQNLEKFLGFFWDFLGIFWGNVWEFLGGFFGGIYLEEFFGRNFFGFFWEMFGNF